MHVVLERQTGGPSDQAGRRTITQGKRGDQGFFGVVVDDVGFDVDAGDIVIVVVVVLVILVVVGVGVVAIVVVLSL